MEKKSTVILLSFLAGLFLTLIVTAFAASNPDSLSIVRPADYSVVEGEMISIVIKLNGDIDAVTVTRNGDEIFNVTGIKGREYLCKTGKLNFGPNEIIVNAFEGSRIVETKKITVFYRSDLSREFGISPREFQKKPFHKEDNEKACLPCHRMKVSEKDFRPKKPDDSICYTCHKKITDYSYVHGPAATWDCLFCHEQNARPVKYITRQPEKESCFVCHTDKKEEWTPKKYWHGPIAIGKCSVCHNPHASNNISSLKKPTWDLCVTCHEDRAVGRHVIAGFVFGDSHPTRGVPDPLRPGRELTCASCHNPHASNSKSLFNHGAIGRMSLCIVCHKK